MGGGGRRNCVKILKKYFFFQHKKQKEIASQNDKGVKRKVLKTAYRRAANYGKLLGKLNTILFFLAPTLANLVNVQHLDAQDLLDHPGHSQGESFVTQPYLSFKLTTLINECFTSKVKGTNFQ